MDVFYLFAEAIFFCHRECALQGERVETKAGAAEGEGESAPYACAGGEMRTASQASAGSHGGTL